MVLELNVSEAPMINLSLTALEQHFRDIEAIGEETDWNGAFPCSKLEFWHGSFNGDRILFKTKGRGLMGIREWDGEATHGASIFAATGPVSDAYADHIAFEANRLNAPVLFVGDLAPIDLTCFLTLAVRLQSRNIQVRYHGINDAWLHHADPFKLYPSEFATIALSEHEQTHLKLLEALPIHWQQILGIRSLALLKSGQKLELEGATNPGLYREGFSREMEKLLFESSV